MQSEPTSQPQSVERLPVNPRRTKVAPEQRKRVTTACNACNVRRVRCSGDKPCQRCRRVSRECVYPAPESHKSALKGEVERLQKRCAALEQYLQVTRPDHATDILAQLDRKEITLSRNSTCHSAPSESDDPDSTEGRLLLDPDGTVRYFGETSGATFLDYLKHFMLTLVPLAFQTGSDDGSSFVASIGQYQTFDSRPLPNPEVDPLWLPSPEDMTSMLAELCYYVQDGNGRFPSGGIYWWGELNSLPAPISNSSVLNSVTTDDASRFLAFYHVCFALASSAGYTSFRHSDQHAGAAFFKRARILIGNPLDTVRFTLSDVPVLALMGFYLIEVNRRDAAYMYISLAIHIAVIHGAFKSCLNEVSKRSFWTLYILDRWLAVLMGRPPTISDEAIKLPMPRDVASMPPCAGLIAHVELSRISGHIVCETFRVASRNKKPVNFLSSIDEALGMLQDWKTRLPPTLQMPESLNHPDPSCCILHMAHNQLILLTTRHVFFAAVKKAVAQQVIHDHSPFEQCSYDRLVQACSQAAHRNMLLAQRLIASGHRLLQAGLHFVFNAAVILLLKRILDSRPGAASQGFGNYNGSKLHYQEHEAPPEIQSAIKIFEEEARTGTNYPRDCCRVLQDLRALTGRYVSLQSEAALPQVSIPGDLRASLQARDSSNFLVDDPHRAHLVEPDEIYHEMMTWAQGDELQLQKGSFL